MTDEQEPSGSGPEVVTWTSVRDRLFRFARNVFRFEKTLDRLVESHANQQKLLNDLHDRVLKLEAQQEIIIRLLERDRRE